MAGTWKIFWSSSLQRVVDVCYCAPRPTRLESRRPLARLWSSDFGPQDPWFIPPPSHANSHPQHCRASQPDRTPASVSPFGVVPSRSVYAKTDWVPVVLLGSCLGIRSDKPVSRRTHFPLPFGDCIPAGARGREENRIPSANG